MPRVVVHREPSVRSRRAELLLGESLYQITPIPYLDFEKEKQETPNVFPDAIRGENVLPCEQIDRQNICSSVTEVTCSRDVRAGDEEDKQTFAKDVRVRVPNMECEVATLFAHARTMPPPPPSHATATPAPLRLWYDHVIADEPLYHSCCGLAGFPLLPFPSDGAVDATDGLTTWAFHANEWWCALSRVMTTNGLGCNVPLVSRWNPYSVVLTRRFMKIADTTVQMAKHVAANSQSPPAALPSAPLTYDTLVAHLCETGSNSVQAELLSQEYVTHWWREATAWAASVSASTACKLWICPPPTTGDSTKMWFHKCRQWFDYVSEQIRTDGTAKKPRRKH